MILFRLFLPVILITLISLLNAPALCRGDTKPFFGIALDGLPITSLRLARTESELGLPVSMVVFFLQWPEIPEPYNGELESIFPEKSLAAIHEQGAVPCITWEPMFITAEGQESIIPAGDITSGKYDSYIRNFAGSLKMFGYPIIIRLAHEPNIPRYHWGSPSGFDAQAPARFKAIFKHVVNIFREEEARNAKFAFCANAESYPFTPWNKIKNYYPGNEYVDVMGIDGYNWGDTQTKEKHGWDSRFLSFAEIFGSMRDKLKGINSDLPLIVFETAGAAGGGDKEEWLKEMARTAMDWNLAGLCWFQADKEIDWRIGSGLREMSPSDLKPYFSGDSGQFVRLLEADK